jgi:hypothetical protein
VERQLGGDLLGPKGAGVFLFIEEPDTAYPDVIVIEIEFVGVVNRVSQLDALSDIGGRDFVEGALEADGGIVIDDAFVSEKKNFVELCFRESTDLDTTQGGVIAVDGPLTDAVMELVMVVVAEPQGEGLIELMKGDPLLDSGQEAVPDCAKESFHFSARGAVIGFGVDEGDAGQGCGFG